MFLYLMRHSFAAWPAEQGSDDQRPLTPLGVQRAQAVGAALARRNIIYPEVILHSPFVRARDTAAQVATALALTESVQSVSALQPGFDAKRLRHLLQAHAHRESVLLVGHMPDMSDVVRTLTGRLALFGEATVACLQIDHPADDPRGVLLWLASAEELTATQA